MAVAMLAKEKHGEKAPRGLQTLKISNIFASTGRRNPPRAAKLDGGGSKLRTPRKRPAEGTPRKMAQGGEVKFPFRLDCKRAYAVWSVQAKPPTIAAKYNDPDDRTNQRPYGGHGKAGAPKLPAKDGHGLKIASSNKDDSDGNEVMRVGATKRALHRASAAAKDKQGIVIARVDEDDSDDDESASAGASKLAWFQALATAAKTNGRVRAAPHARGQEAERRNSLSASILQGCTPLRMRRRNPPPSPPSTTTRRTEPTSSPMAATERRKHPRHPPRAGAASRLQAMTRMTQTTMRSCAWVPQSRRCSKPRRLLLSGAKSARTVVMAEQGCTRTTASRQQPNLPPEPKGACPTTKRGPHLRASRVPRL